MIAVDTNILVYAHRRDSPWHGAAAGVIGGLASGRGAWAIAWPSLHEFIGVVTHPRIYAPPSRIEEAFAQVQAWRASPALQFLAEGPGHLDELEGLMASARAAGPAVHDARIAAICLQHGVSELWTADRDFSRFPALKTRNPLVG